MPPARGWKPRSADRLFSFAEQMGQLPLSGRAATVQKRFHPGGISIESDNLVSEMGKTSSRRSTHAAQSDYANPQSPLAPCIDALHRPRRDGQRHQADATQIQHPQRNFALATNPVGEVNRDFRHFGGSATEIELEQKLETARRCGLDRKLINLAAHDVEAAQRMPDSL